MREVGAAKPGGAATAEVGELSCSEQASEMICRVAGELGSVPQGQEFGICRVERCVKHLCAFIKYLCGLHSVRAQQVSPATPEGREIVGAVVNHAHAENSLSAATVIRSLNSIGRAARPPGYPKRTKPRRS